MPARQAYNNSHIHILVVDDEPEIAESLADFLTQKEGYRVTQKENGREAIRFLQSAPDDVDLILLDMRMPHLSGLEVLAWIRRHPRLQYMRVIVLTAASGNQEKVEALSAGADDYITKPYYPQELLARVKTILRSRQLEKELQRQSQQLAALNQASRQITTTLKSHQVMAAGAAGAIKSLDAAAAALFMVNDSQTALLCRSFEERENEGVAPDYEPIPIERGLLGAALRSQSPICVNDLAQEKRFRPASDAPPHLSVYNLMAGRLLARGRAVGVLAVYNKQEADASPGKFARIDVTLFGALADSISRAIENAWLFQSVRLRQQELLESRNTLQAVIDGILQPIYTINEAWQLVAVNQTKADERGETAGPLEGQVCYTAFYGRDEPCDHCRAAQTLIHQQARRWPARWVDEDHLPREWDVSAYPIPAKKAGAARAVIVWQDRTEERRLESSLTQAGKLAAIGQLAAGVAHEINNPLTVIKANAEMLKMVIPADDDSYEAVDLITRAGDRATKVVGGLLDFARQSQYDFVEVPVNESIRQALDLVSYQLESANIEIRLHLAENIPPVMASREHLKSVWLNLLVNARDAVQDRPEPRQIEITSRSSADGRQIHILFQDNGEGISPAELAHIFEPFYTTKEPGKGTGLGLATCHRIVEQHGGQIEATSSPNKGTTFIIRLPAAE